MENRSLTLSRLLALVAFIERYPGISVDELSEHFRRDPEAIRKDIAVLDRAGFGDSLPDETFFINMDRYLTHDELEIHSNLQVESAPRLTAQEAAVLVVGLGALTVEDEELQGNRIPGLIAKILALAGQEAPGVGYRIKVIESNASTETRRIMNEAIRETRQVKIRYLSATERETQRIIDPLKLARIDDGWLLDAWCHDANSSRTFRLDRILDCEILSSPQKPGEPEPRDTAPECTVLLGPDSQWRHQELAASKSQYHGTCMEATFKVWDDEWVVSQVLALAPDIQSVRPKHFQKVASERAKTALQIWESFPSPLDQ